MTGRLLRALTALSENTYLSAVRAGMVAIVPLTIIGGLFLIVAHLPVAGWEARSHLMPDPGSPGHRDLRPARGVRLPVDRLRPGQASARDAISSASICDGRLPELQVDPATGLFGWPASGRPGCSRDSHRARHRAGPEVSSPTRRRDPASG